MTDAPYDFVPLEPAMPPSVRALLEASRRGEGQVAWLTQRALQQHPGAALALLRGNPPMPAPERGWVAGLALLVTKSDSIVDVVEWENARDCVPTVLEALAAALAVGRTLEPNVWKCIERLVKLMPFAANDSRRLPLSLRAVLERGLREESAVSRGVALRLSALVPRAPVQLDETSPLQRLVRAWGETFDERLIEPLVAAGLAASNARGPVKAKSKTELEGAWHAIAADRDPADVQRLLATPWPGQWKVALARAQALAKFPPDPRIPLALEEQVSRFTSMGARSFRAAWVHLNATMKKAKRADAPPELLRLGASTHGVELAPLWSAFWEVPTDAARRAVLADALQHAGDPRGEFIALQTAGDDGPRAQELLEQNLESWVGGLPNLERASREFRGGFLGAVKLLGEPEAAIASASMKEWRTVERLELAALGSYRLAELLEKLIANMPSLQTLLLSRHASVPRELKASFPQVRSLGVSEWTSDVNLAPFPGLKMVSTGARDARVPLELARRAGLEVLTLVGVEVTAELVERISASSLREVRLVPNAQPFQMKGPVLFVPREGDVRVFGNWAGEAFGQRQVVRLKGRPGSSVFEM